MVFQDKTSVDLTKIETVLTLAYRSRGAGANEGTEFGYFGEANPARGAAVWDINGVYGNPVSIGLNPPRPCGVNKDTPPTKLENDISISKTMLAPAKGLYRMLPVNSCTYDRTRKNDKPIEFSVDGSTVRLGDRKWNLSMESEAVTLLGVDPRLREGEIFNNDEPGFHFEGSDKNTNYSLYYSRNKEILWFSMVEINKSMTFCAFDMRGQDL